MIYHENFNFSLKNQTHCEIAKSLACTACVPSTPRTPIPMWAVWKNVFDVKFLSFGSQNHKNQTIPLKSTTKPNLNHSHVVCAIPDGGRDLRGVFSLVFFGSWFVGGLKSDHTD
mgnify:CR=1 FL=1